MRLRVLIVALAIPAALWVLGSAEGSDNPRTGFPMPKASHNTETAQDQLHDANRLCTPENSWAPCVANGDNEPLVPLPGHTVVHVTAQVEEDEAYCAGSTEVSFSRNRDGSADIECAVSK